MGKGERAEGQTMGKGERAEGQTMDKGERAEGQTMDKGERAEGQTMINNTLHRKLKFEQHEAHLKPEVNSVAPERLECSTSMPTVLLLDVI
jgi:hypothetical protein